MSEIEVGEYIRTKKGNIGKVLDITTCTGQKRKKYLIKWNTSKAYYITSATITTHSKNIINLIEEGDYVNGMRVIATENRGRYNEEKQKDEKVILAENYDEWTENGVISNEDINTIVTKEQFNSVMYKVVE